MILTKSLEYHKYGVGCEFVSANSQDNFSRQAVALLFYLETKMRRIINELIFSLIEKLRIYMVQ